MRLGGAKRCWVGFKVIILRVVGRRRGRATKRGPVFIGFDDPSANHEVKEGGSDFMILLF